MKTKGGAKTWYFPDGYLPAKTGDSKMEAHEALMLLNTGNEPANVRISFYFTDRPAIHDISTNVEAERVRTLRLDHPDEIGGTVIPPLTQYALRVKSDRPLVAQFGRLDTTQANMAYYVGVGFCE